jgi:hypothetical protein
VAEHSRGGREGGNPDGIRGRGGKKRQLTEKMKLFKAEILKGATPSQAAAVAGYKNPQVLGLRLTDPNYYPVLANEISKALARKEERAALKADEVLRYIHDVMSVNLGRWFLPGDGGGWLIDEDGLKNLPPEVARLIECIEKREIAVGEGPKAVRRTTFWVKIVSKTKAMELAAKHQLGERHEHVVTTVNWAGMYARPARPEDPGDKRIRELGAGGRRVSVEAEPVPPREGSGPVFPQEGSGVLPGSTTEEELP